MNSNKNKIYFRVDGGENIGSGHIVRCAALAHMLKKDFEISFVLEIVPEDLCDELVKSGFTVIRLSSVNEFTAMLSSKDIVVVDGYHFDAKYQKKIKQTEAVLVSIDDLHDKKFYSDLIINHSPSVNPQDYNVEYYTQFALGLEYSLLRPKFLIQAQKSRSNERINTVLICFGGADPKKLTEIVLKEVVEFDVFKRIIVITGHSYGAVERIKDASSKDKRIHHFCSIGENEMFNLMLEAQIAIVPSSGILLEALAVGLKIISGFYIENQKHLYSNYKKMNAFIDAYNFAPEHVRNALCEGVNKSTIPEMLIDGMSEKRLSKYFAMLASMSEITARKSNYSDLNTTLKWAQSPQIRSFSFNQNPITFEEHKTWFYSKLENDNCAYFIIESKKMPVGSIRFDIVKGEAIISYLVDKDHQGKGLGQLILKKGVEELIKSPIYSSMAIQKVMGFVIPENVPSVKAFQRLGYQQIIEKNRVKFEKEIR